ncbi:unnamed protein product [Rotaria magnacalcarata]|uniref:Globin-sensor domain-containing protein n=1 Tax=Rotaria magnacalcarata TaxID=392030 RepID=A0A816YNI4_9BILA|nr:unnamed protein product [Rotaria magnacalcarata]CAF1377592.1 unnamed protein product [Rotaria magnacalcarata]CAF1997856.1 unnamed protein product [Rotaria magnacalcarata]CAF2163525.1 unnamed protein product [Rotaria magnacalcarata]CAF3906946.1 unnamed protein product [Rotaria magnacalcarata]
MTEHVDSNQLNDDVRYRFEYLSKFLNFTSDDITMLNDFALILSSRIPVITDTVYRKLFSFDITKHYFIIRNHDFDKSSTNHETNLTLESAQMTFRKDMLSKYLKRIFTEKEWNDTFLQYLSQIGRIHTNQAGLTSINVDYIHINALLGYLESSLIDIILSAENLDEITKRAMTLAINKLFWIQNDFFSMHFLAGPKDNSSARNKNIKNPPSCCLLN